MKKYCACLLLACTATTASVSASQTLTATQGLAFGRFAAASGGTVTIGATGTRSQGGGVVLLPSGSGASALFSVSGTPSATYAISLPANGVVSLTHGASSMAVNFFTSSPSLSGTLGLGGTQMLSVGATLGVGALQTSGSYGGSFSVILNYN